MGFTEVNTSFSQVPKYICEYKNNTLRIVNTFGFGLFNTMMAQNINVSQNITAEWFIGKIEWANIQNKFITAVDNNWLYMNSTTATFNETKLYDLIYNNNLSLLNYIDTIANNLNTTSYSTFLQNGSNANFMELEADSINVSYIYSRFSGTGFDLTGDPYYIGGVDLRIDQNLIVDDNITAQKIIINGSELHGVSFYYNKTATSYTGDLGGYVNASALCNAEFEGTHLCSQTEIDLTRSYKNISTLSTWINGSEAWSSTFSAKYSPATLPCDDCHGWTWGTAGTYLGNWWYFDNNGGVGRTGHCGNTLPLACCKKW
jgi:hypothetical protein